jgi:hypothetical protein
VKIMLRPQPLGIALLAASLLIAVAARSASAQVPVVVGPSASGASQDQLELVRRSLNEGPGLKLDDRQLRFYLEIVAKLPTFAEYSKGYDFMGPAKGGNPMTHAEFLKMVTPKEMYSQAGITASDQLQFAVTNWLGKSLIKKALDQLKDARTDREALEIRERIERELTALTGAVKSK